MLDQLHRQKKYIVKSRLDAEIEAHIYDKQVTLPPIESALVGSLISFPEEVGMNNLQLNDPCVQVYEHFTA